MRYALLGRSVVCLTAGLPSPAVDLSELEEKLELERPASQVTTPPVVLADYARVRLIAQAGQVQLEFKENAGKELIRRGTREILRQVRLHTSPAVGFNVVLRVTADEDEDVFASLIRTDTLAERLSVASVRPGLRATWKAEDSVDTLGIDADQNDESAWLAQLNRHHARDPDAEATRRAISWLAAADAEMEKLLRRLLRPADD